MPRTGFEITPPTRGGNQAVVFKIDKSGFYKGAKETGVALTSMQRKINSEIRRTGYSKNVKIDMKIEGGAMFSQVVVRTLDEAVDAVSRQWAKQIAASGKDFFKTIIRTAPNRVKGEPGRIDTGLMLRSVQGRSYDNKDATYVGIGWDIAGGTYYRYFSFQEDGTRNGPMPMRAVPQTARFLSKQFEQGLGKELKIRLDSIK
jgi:hypothetical protein